MIVQKIFGRGSVNSGGVGGCFAFVLAVRWYTVHEKFLMAMCVVSFEYVPWRG